MPRIALAAIALVAATPSWATGEIEGLITQTDRERLANFETTRAEALKEARDGGAAADVAILDRLVDARQHGLGQFDRRDFAARDALRHFGERRGGQRFQGVHGESSFMSR